MPKTFDLNACGDRHQRPINSKCTRIIDSEAEDGISVASTGQSDINLQILSELKSLSGRMTAMEQRVDKVEKPGSPKTSMDPETTLAVSTIA